MKFIFAFLLTVFSLNAAVQDHFKPAPDKGDNHGLANTDQDTKNDFGVHVPATAGAVRPNFKGKGPQAYRARRDIDGDFRSIGARYGAYSYIVNRAGMEKILNHIKTNKIFLPYDMDIYMRDDVRMFNLRLDVVSTKPGSISDNGVPRYLNKEA